MIDDPEVPTPADDVPDAVTDVEPTPELDAPAPEAPAMAGDIPRARFLDALMLRTRGQLRSSRACPIHFSASREHRQF